MATRWKERSGHNGRSRSVHIYNFRMASDMVTFIWMGKIGITDGEKYLGMSMRAGGLQSQISDGRVEGAEKEVRRLLISGWWSMALKSYQIRPDFNAVVRAKYQHGLFSLEKS